MTQIKLSDAVMEHLAAHGVEDVFLVSGGGIMHLLDSVGRNPRLRYICNYHEQACAIAAEAYARLRSSIGVCLVTTGPGSTNALSGVAGAWFDSVPVVVVSGQVRVPLIADHTRLRQLGPQEVNIIPMAEPVTKYAVSLRDPNVALDELEKAVSAATSGRPGPSWIDVPLDIQSAALERSEPASCSLTARKPKKPSQEIVDNVAKTVELLRKSKRPVIIGGNGIRLAGATERFQRLLEQTRIPVLLSITGMDLVDEGYRYHLGAFGPFGRRAANFALQNSDLFISIGASLSIAMIGFNTDTFAPRAQRVVVNVDPGELSKQTLRIDVPVECDASLFLEELERQLAGASIGTTARWLEACDRWKETYPPGPPAEMRDHVFINSYDLVEVISSLMGPGEVVVTGNSLDACSVYQSFHVKRDQRVLINANYGSMGWDLPAAVGAAVAAKGKRVVLITGDGSLQFNVQELMTIGHYGLDVKIFVLNNDGYESIRSTQTNYFEARFVGSDRASGIANPKFDKLAEAYGLGYLRLEGPAGLPERVQAVLDHPGPILCEVIISPTQPRTPKASSYRRPDGTMESRPIEDMFPFLPREEVHYNMHLFDDE